MLGATGGALLLSLSLPSPRVRGGDIIVKPLTVEELAEALGVEATCWDVRFAAPCYVRLVATITDGEERRREECPVPYASANFHLRILLVRNGKHGPPQHLSYGIFRLADEGYAFGRLVESGGSERYLHFESGYWLVQMESGGDAGKHGHRFRFKSTRTERRDDRDVTVPGPSMEVHIVLETSPEPFPPAPEES